MNARVSFKHLTTCSFDDDKVWVGLSRINTCYGDYLKYCSVSLNQSSVKSCRVLQGPDSICRSQPSWRWSTHHLCGKLTAHLLNTLRVMCLSDSFGAALQSSFFFNLMHRSRSHRQHPELVDSWSQKLLFVKVTSTLNCYWTLFKRKEISNETSIDKVKIEGHDLLCPSIFPAVLDLDNAPWHNFFGHTLRPFLYSYRPWVAHFASRHLSLRWPFLPV